jgi:hypothetical protein
MIQQKVDNTINVQEQKLPCLIIPSQSAPKIQVIPEQRKYYTAKSRVV